MDMQIAKEILTVVESGDCKKAEELIGSDKERLNFSTSVFGTWLHVAAKRGKLDMVKYLVESGMDINRRSGTSDSYAINQAVTWGHIDVVKYLLSRGAKLDVSDPVRNPLFDAITDGRSEMVRLLIDSGINIHVKYENNRDALAYAIERGQTEIADILRTAMGQSSTAKQQTTDAKIAKWEPHNEILNYVSRCCGKIGQTISEIVPGSRVAIDLHIIPASKTRNYITLVTTGMSDYPMDEAEEAAETAYAELLIKLPADWPIEESKMNDEKNYWPLALHPASN